MENSKNEIPDFSPKNLPSRTRQGWRDLLQRVLNQQFNECRYEIEEQERIYRVLAPTFHCLPNQGINESKVHPLAAIVHYGRIENEKASMILIALFEERTKSINQKRVTIITSPKWRPSVDESQSKLNKSLRKSSHADEPFSSFTRLSRFSLHSISYGFGLGTKIRKSTPPDANLSPANTYRLPSNKIELDSNQQELLRRSGSLKKSM